MIRLLPALVKKDRRDNLVQVVFQKALLLVKRDKVTEPQAPLQVRGLKSHPLGVGVASVHSLAS